MGLTAVFEPVDGGNMRMVERGEDLRLALEADEAIAIEREHGRYDLQRDVATKFRVACAIHLTHAAGAEGGEDLVRAEASPGGQGHARPLILRLYALRGRGVVERAVACSFSFAAK